MNGRQLELPENKLQSELHATCAPDNLTFPVVDVYTHSKNILFRTIQQAINDDTLDEVPNQDILGIPNEGSATQIQIQYDITKLSTVQSSKIERVACEIIGKNLDRADPQETTISIFKILRGYTTWEAKLVIILAAFAVNYGEFWLLVRSFSKDQKDKHATPLARSMAVLKRLSVDLTGNSIILGNLAGWYDTKLCPVILKLLQATDTVVEFFKIESKYDHVPSLQTAKYQISFEVNQIVLSILACVTEIFKITDPGFDFKQSASDITWRQEWERKLGKALDALQGQLKKCNDDIEKEKNGQIYQKLESLLSVPIASGDIFSVLEALMASTEQKALYRISDGKKWEAEVKIASLPPKTNVLLFISNLTNDNGVLEKEIKELQDIYSKIPTEQHRDLYKLLWIPIKGQPTESEDAFQKFATWMNKAYWYSVSKLKHIHQSVIRFFKEKWSFKGKSMLVVINDSGVVVNQDAYRMIRIWQEKAFPFDSRTEAKLWSEQPWSSDILIHQERDVMIKKWVNDKDIYTFFCGGRDMKWLDYFLGEFKKAAEFMIKGSGEEGEPKKFLLHTVYLGKNSKESKVTSIFDKVKRELESQKADDSFIYCPPADQISFFWQKLKSMKLSVSQQATVKDDAKEKKQAIQKLLSYNGGVGWVVLCNGTRIILTGYGSTVLALLQGFNADKGKTVAGFEKFFTEKYDSYESDYGICCSLDFPLNSNISAEEHACPHCGKYTMKKKIKLYCCHKCWDCWVCDQSPTLAKSGEDYGYISMDIHLH